MQTQTNVQACLERSLRNVFALMRPRSERQVVLRGHDSAVRRRRTRAPLTRDADTKTLVLFFDRPNVVGGFPSHASVQIIKRVASVDPGAAVQFGATSCIGSTSRPLLDETCGSAPWVDVSRLAMVARYAGGILVLGHVCFWAAVQRYAGGKLALQ